MPQRLTLIITFLKEYLLYLNLVLFDLKLKRYSIAILRKVSIKDIAEAAGVSVTLASFV